MCRIGQRCASHADEHLTKSQEVLKATQNMLQQAKESKDTKQIDSLNAQVSQAQTEVQKAQHMYDSTRTGMKKLIEQGYKESSTRYKRASLQNVFGRTVLARKKETGQNLPSKEVIFI